MSRFSKAEAESRGWRFAHEREQYDVVESGTQGRTRTVPATVRAEKYLVRPGRESVLINEEAETLGLLLERIAAREALIDQEEGREYDSVVRELESTPLSDEGIPQRTVSVPTDPADLSIPSAAVNVTEEEFAARDRGDVLLVRGEDGEPEQRFFGGAGDEISEAADNRSDREAEIENRRTAERAIGSQKQVKLDPADVGPDAPGATGTGTVIIRGDEDSVQDALARKAALKAQAEDARIVAITEQGEPHTPEGAELLAGVDVGIQERGDLGSEIPPVGAVPGNTEFGEPAREAAEESAKLEKTETAGEVEAKERSEADEAEAKKARDAEEDGLADGETAEEAVDATPAARAAAEQEGISLLEVEGTGKGGRVTKGDVDAAASE